jgi:hypothetical protein
MLGLSLLERLALFSAQDASAAIPPITIKIMPVVSTFECDADAETKFQQLPAPAIPQIIVSPDLYGARPAH